MADLRAGVLIAALTLCAGASGCSSASETPGADAQATTAADAASSVGSVSCAADPRVQAFALGMSEDGANHTYKFVLVSSEPGPPAVAIDSWVVKLVDETGNPVTDATFSGLKVWMPDHQHGWTGVTSKSNGDGTYTLDGLDFFMSGVWQIYMTATSGTTVDTAIFSLCIGG